MKTANRLTCTGTNWFTHLDKPRRQGYHRGWMAKSAMTKCNPHWQVPKILRQICGWRASTSSPAYIIIRASRCLSDLNWFEKPNATVTLVRATLG